MFNLGHVRPPNLIGVCTQADKLRLALFPLVYNFKVRQIAQPFHDPGPVVAQDAGSELAWV